ncbi:MAG: hypothetical protein GY754_41390 [bacterium]|nr:hypothetical protein [bacterium]
MKELKLNQVIAIANGEKTRKQKLLTKIYQNLDKSTLFEGISKRYKPIDEEGERKPDETKYVQVTVPQAIDEAIQVMKDMFNIVATQDIANCSATADLIVDDKTFLENVPVTHLLFLEKQLDDIQTFINSFPILDPAEKWVWNDDSLCYASDSKESHSTKKVLKTHVKYEATDKHPAQTEVYNEDVVVGYWTTIKFSGNISKKDKEDLLEKVRKLSRAVKIAREEANSSLTKMSDFGDTILNYIFKK